MSEKGNMPKFTGDGVALWENTDKNGKTYMTVQLFGKNGIRINAWLYEPKTEEQKE